MRGEHKIWRCGIDARKESPPLARRARTRNPTRPTKHGITSACAESTRCSSTPRLARWNHLRLRGEHPGARDRAPFCRESPPLARRAPPVPVPGARRSGITSACAESTFSAISLPMLSRNHLRLRGEHITTGVSDPGFMESPPLARRALLDGTQVGAHLGITSACAESTQGWFRVGVHSRNHLRLRGEHSRSPPARRRRTESPPLARRAPRIGRRVSDRPGITSACAESTERLSPATNRHRNHLRLRGEHPRRYPPTCQYAESPPLARRARVYGVHEFAVEGITSACAESTVRTRFMITPIGNHLRLRGEHA